ncbi:MAG: bifunctional homocysteine S-methyltransferase/methylenetetrahydrofolate reductase [Vicinamibacterales bacterium]
MRTFLEELDDRVLVCDGAMGTMLYSKGVFVNRSFDALNLTEPDLVAEVHLEYIRAGADVIETNTFGANRLKLGAFGLADRLHAINVRGAQVARHAARERAYVAGAIGPLGIRIEPWGRLGVDEAEECFREQASALVEGGVDLFILETFRDLNELGAALAAVRSVSTLPVVAQMTTGEDGTSLDGTPPETFGPALEALGVDVVGVNCSVGPAPMLETVERLAAVTKARLSAQPNGGMPRDIEGRTIYLCSPEYMASYARRFVARGVRLVGGCCGTTPDHIRHIAAAVRALASGTLRRTFVQVAQPAATGAAVEQRPVPVADKSRLANSLARGKSVTLVELIPPRGHEHESLVEAARTLRIRGVDAITIPDGTTSARMSASALAFLIEQHAGVETVLHYACRDRNLLGMQSDLLGAHAMGIRNVLLVTGDPPKLGDYPKATSVYDVDSIGLTNVVTRLNRGIDIGGQSIGRPTAFHVGVAVNPTALDLDRELRRLDYKLEAGAEFVITHPVFNVAALERFLERARSVSVPVIAGVWVFDGLLNAEFLANELPGMEVPQALIERMRRADGEGRAAAEAASIARELIDRLKVLVRGVQVSTQPGRQEAILSVIEAVA